MTKNKGKRFKSMKRTKGNRKHNLVAEKVLKKKLAAEKAASKAAEAARAVEDEAKQTFEDEFKRGTQAARRAPAPEWVKGARPSDECIAAHGYAYDLRCANVSKLDLEKMREEHQDKEPTSDWPVPVFFKPIEVEARGVRCHWASWPYLHGHQVVDIKLGVAIYLHGGNFVAGALDLRKCGHLSRATGKAVLAVDYRRAPEHPLPAATNDVVSVYQWLVEDQHVAPGKITIYGRSAGATLAVLSLQELVKQALPLPACGVASSVWAPHATQAKLWDLVVGNTDAKGKRTGQKNDTQDAKYNILAGSFAGLPPLYVIAGGEEPHEEFLNVSTRLVKTATEAGVQATLDVVPNMHQCPDWCVGFVPEATQAVTRARRFMDDAMAARRNE